MRKVLKKNIKFALPSDELKKFLKLSHNQKAIFLENFALKAFEGARHLQQLRYLSIMERSYVYDVEDFSQVVYLPFEKIKLPFPASYDKILT